MNRILFFKLFFILSIWIQAQTALISGKIIVDDAKEIINLDGFIIENLTSNARTKANENGLFSINVKANDELIFKQMGLIERQLKISENMIKKGFIEVHVNVEVIELAETNISKLDFSKINNLGKEKTFSDKMNDEMGINSKEFKKELTKLHEYSNIKRKPNPYAGNLLELAKIFKTSNGKGLLDKKKLSAFEKVYHLKSMICETYFIKELNILRDKIIDFIGLNVSNYKFDKLMRSKKIYKIKSILKEQAPIYLKKINDNE